MKTKKSISLSPATYATIFSLALVLSVVAIVFSFAIGYLKHGTLSLGITMAFILAFAWLLFFLFDSGRYRALAARLGCYTRCKPNVATIRTRNGKSEVMPYDPMLGVHGFFHRRSDKITVVSKELVCVDILVSDLLYKDNRKDTIRLTPQFSPNSDDCSILALERALELEEYSSLKKYIESTPRFDIMKEEIETALRQCFSEKTFETIDKESIAEVVMNKLSIPNIQLLSLTITRA